MTDAEREAIQAENLRRMSPDVEIEESPPWTGDPQPPQEPQLDEPDPANPLPTHTELSYFTTDDDQ